MNYQYGYNRYSKERTPWLNSKGVPRNHKLRDALQVAGAYLFAGSMIAITAIGWM